VQQGPAIPCHYCQQSSIASDLLFNGVTLDYIACPSCLSTNISPPVSFFRQTSLLKLHEKQGDEGSMRCTKEDSNICVLGILVPNCVALHCEGKYSRLAQELSQTLHQEDNQVLFWPGTAEGSGNKATAEWAQCNTQSTN